jgi:2-hydroxychromene-2-carboxylate isomerase
MGELVDLAEHRKRRMARVCHDGEPLRAEFLFDLACPFSYLVAERTERSFDDIRWTPAASAGAALDPDLVRSAAEARAAALRLPLIWPDAYPAPVPAAMRVAAYASSQGRGAAFALAAGRLAFCGGFDLDDPEILAEAAGAAGLALGDCLNAARDVRRDAAIGAAGLRLLAAGADRLPALRVGRALFWGEQDVAVAAATARRSTLAAGRLS